MEQLPYDGTNPSDILKYSEQLIGGTFVDVLKQVFDGKELDEQIEKYNNVRNKGGLGALLEEHYYFYSPNSQPEADFAQAGVELKVTPYEYTKKGIKAGERLVITMIPNNEPLPLSFDESYLKKKISQILMVWYNRLKEIPRTSSRIGYVNLYNLYSELCKKDLAIICEDYKVIANKIISGKAHELSEGDTRYLGACTKGSTASKSLQPQYYNTDILAKRRAFSFKQSYMTYVLNNYVLEGLMTYDAIFNDSEIVDFDSQVIEKIHQYIGKTESELYELFKLNSNKKPKHINSVLVCRMLGVKTNNTEEFAKANIVIKTIRVQKNGVPRESMSFPKIHIQTIVNQEFEESYEYAFFEETRFLFVVFQEREDGEYRLRGAKFWNMPKSELEGIGKSEWEAYKNKFKSGVKFNVSYTKKGKLIVTNDLPKKSSHEIFHLRPHAIKSAYLINGKRYGNGKDSDMAELPNGDKMTHQCFWLNNTYIAKIVSDILRE